MPHKNKAKRTACQTASQRKRRERKRAEALGGTPPEPPPADTPTGPGPPPLPLTCAADALAILAEQLNAVRADTRAPVQAKGRTVAYMIAVALKALEVADLAERIAALEAAEAERKKVMP